MFVPHLRPSFVLTFSTSHPVSFLPLLNFCTHWDPPSFSIHQRPTTGAILPGSEKIRLSVTTFLISSLSALLQLRVIWATHPHPSPFGIPSFSQLFPILGNKTLTICKATQCIHPSILSRMYPHIWINRVLNIYYISKSVFSRSHCAPENTCQNFKRDFAVIYVKWQKFGNAHA